MSQSVLELFILSLIDRGLQTAYDLQHQAAISLGSSTPALQRLATAKLIKLSAATNTSRRLRHSYRITAAGRRLARTGWIGRLKDPAANDFDAVLRLVDMATHYQAKAEDIATFLKRAAGNQTAMTASKRSSSILDESPQTYLSTVQTWNVTRRRAESRFLFALANSLLQS